MSNIEPCSSIHFFAYKKTIWISPTSKHLLSYKQEQHKIKQNGWLSWRKDGCQSYDEQVI